MKYLKSFRNFAIEKPYQAILSVLGLIGTVFGTIRAISSINENFGVVPAFISLTVIAIIIGYVIINYMEYDLFKSYKISPDQSYIYHSVEQRWHILRSGAREISCKRDFIFFKHPEPDDCVDILFGSLSLDIDSLNYKSPDSSVEHCILARGDAINVYWKPIDKEIEIGESYTHEFSYVYPAGTETLEKSITAASRVYAREMKFFITTENTINRVVVTKNEDKLAFWDSKAIFEIEKNSYPSFVKKLDENEIELKFDRLERGDSYFIKIYLDEKDSSI